VTDELQAAWARNKAAGKFDSKRWNGFDKKRTDKDRIRCKNGKAVAVKGDASQTYKCKDIVSVTHARDKHV
jgi:hypothetical protein